MRSRTAVVTLTLGLGALTVLGMSPGSMEDGSRRAPESVFLEVVEAPVDVEAGWCSLSCVNTCPAGYHKAYLEGDPDEWDGGNHPNCLDKACCWQTGGSGECKHPACEGIGGEDKDLLAAVAGALDDSDVTTLVDLLLENRSLYINKGRTAVQLISECDQTGEPIAQASLPISETQLTLLTQLLD